MAKSTVRVQRGRPQRNAVDILFTRAWFSVIAVESGLGSTYAVQRALEEAREAAGLTSPHNWQPYRAGQRVPGPGFVAIADAKYPGTGKIFDSPLRTILRGDAVSDVWIHDQLLALPGDIVELLVWPLPACWVSAPLVLLRPFNDHSAKQLALVGGLHALEGAVLLMKLGELASTPELRRLAREAYIRTRPSVRAQPGFSSVAEELFACIDIAFPRWHYIRPDFCCELVDYGAKSKLQTPDEFLAEENDPRTIHRLLRVALELRVLKACLRAKTLQAR